MDGAQRRGRGRRLSKASGCEAAWVNAADNANTVVGVGEEGSGMARGGGRGGLCWMKGPRETATQGAVLGITLGAVTQTAAGPCFEAE